MLPIYLGSITTKAIRTHTEGQVTLYRRWSGLWYSVSHIYPLLKAVYVTDYVQKNKIFSFLLKKKVYCFVVRISSDNQICYSGRSRISCDSFFKYPDKIKLIYLLYSGWTQNSKSWFYLKLELFIFKANSKVGRNILSVGICDCTISSSNTIYLFYKTSCLFHGFSKKYWFVLENSVSFYNQVIDAYCLSHWITSFILFLRDLLWIVITVWNITEAQWKSHPEIWTFFEITNKCAYKIVRLAH